MRAAILIGITLILLVLIYIFRKRMKKKEGFAIGTLDKDKMVIVPVAIAYFTETVQGTTPAGTIVWDGNATQPTVSATGSVHRNNSQFLNSATYATNAEITEYVNAGGAISTGSSLLSQSAAFRSSTVFSELSSKTFTQSMPSMPGPTTYTCRPVFLKMTSQAYETAHNTAAYNAINYVNNLLRNPYDSYLMLAHYKITGTGYYIVFNIGPPRTLRSALTLPATPTILQQAECFVVSASDNISYYFADLLAKYISRNDLDSTFGLATETQMQQARIYGMSSCNNTLGWYNKTEFTTSTINKAVGGVSQLRSASGSTCDDSYTPRFKTNDVSIISSSTPPSQIASTYKYFYCYGIKPIDGYTAKFNISPGSTEITLTVLPFRTAVTPPTTSSFPATSLTANATTTTTATPNITLPAQPKTTLAYYMYTNAVSTYTNRFIETATAPKIITHEILLPSLTPAQITTFNSDNHEVYVIEATETDASRDLVTNISSILTYFTAKVASPTQVRQWFINGGRTYKWSFAAKDNGSIDLTQYYLTDNGIFRREESIPGIEYRWNPGIFLYGLKPQLPTPPTTTPPTTILPVLVPANTITISGTNKFTKEIKIYGFVCTDRNDTNSDNVNRTIKQYMKDTANATTPAGRLLICPAGQTNCNGVCKTLATDSSNCGTCGKVCPTGATCVSNECNCANVAGKPDYCSTTNTCVNFATDTRNCGGCGTVCPTGETCTSNRCACPTGQTRCSNVCVDTNTNMNNCGGCSTQIPTGATSCLGGRYVCPTGQTLCSNTCVDTNTNMNNCGKCSTQIPTGATSCIGGQYVCATGQTLCGTACYPTDSTKTCTNGQYIVSSPVIPGGASASNPPVLSDGASASNPPVIPGGASASNPPVIPGGASASNPPVLSDGASASNPPIVSPPVIPGGASASNPPIVSPSVIPGGASASKIPSVSPDINTALGSATDWQNVFTGGLLDGGMDTSKTLQDRVTNTGVDQSALGTSLGPAWDKILGALSGTDKKCNTTGTGRKGARITDMTQQQQANNLPQTAPPLNMAFLLSTVSSLMTSNMTGDYSTVETIFIKKYGALKSLPADDNDSVLLIYTQFPNFYNNFYQILDENNKRIFRNSNFDIQSRLINSINQFNRDTMIALHYALDPNFIVEDVADSAGQADAPNLDELYETMKPGLLTDIRLAISELAGDFMNKCKAAGGGGAGAGAGAGTGAGAGAGAGAAGASTPVPGPSGADAGAGPTPAYTPQVPTKSYGSLPPVINRQEDTTVTKPKPAVPDNTPTLGPGGTRPEYGPGGTQRCPQSSRCGACRGGGCARCCPQDTRDYSSTWQYMVLPSHGAGKCSPEKKKGPSLIWGE